MSAVSVAVRAVRCQEFVVSQTIKTVELKRHLIISVGALAYLILAVSIASVVIVSRIGAAPVTIGIPQSYMPDHVLPRLPTDNQCFATDAVFASCSVQFSGLDIYIRYRLATGMIVSTSVQVQHLGVADLIAAWGRPTSIRHFGRLIHIYWRNRMAILATCSFQSDNRFDFILYESDLQTALP